MGYDKRIGFEFLHPGPGFGGSCFPKDTAALLYTAAQAGLRLRSPRRRAGRSTARSTSAWSRRSCTRPAATSTACASRVWGLTFKADTDDLRDSPALVIASRLVELGAKVRGYDPAVSAGHRSVAAGDRGVRATPSRSCEARTCSPCSPSGTSSAGSTSTGSARRWRRPRSSTPATCSTRPRCGAAGFAYTGVGR